MMKTEYDFSKGTRGKFFQNDTELNLPVYLDNEVLEYFKKKAQSKGIDLNQLVNDLLRKDIDMIESVK